MQRLKDGRVWASVREEEAKRRRVEAQRDDLKAEVARLMALPVQAAMALLREAIACGASPRALRWLFVMLRMEGCAMAALFADAAVRAAEWYRARAVPLLLGDDADGGVVLLWALVSDFQISPGSYVLTVSNFPLSLGKI